MMSARILVAAHTEYSHRVKLHLSANGFEVDSVADPASVLAALDTASFDLVLFEAGRSEASETALLAACRDRRVPVIAAVEDAGPEREIAWLDAGADGVLAMTANVDLLTARIGALLRLLHASTLPVQGDVIRYDNFEISQERFELRLSGKKVSIPPKELQLLYCLAASPNRVFSREQLLEHVWDFAFLGDSRTVDVHIKRLREKLSGVSPKWELKTVWGVGYKFELYN